MKKLLILLAFILSGCSCLLSQVPPQTIYVNENCQVILPDYRDSVIVTENCEGYTLEQTPDPGTILDINSPAIGVEVIATDAFGNKSNTLVIPVILVDTIPPILEWPQGQIAMNDEQMNWLYKNWEAAVKVHGIGKWLYDMSWTQGMPLADTARILESLHYYTNIIKLSDEEYSDLEAYLDSIN